MNMKNKYIASLMALTMMLVIMMSSMALAAVKAEQAPEDKAANTLSEISVVDKAGFLKPEQLQALTDKIKAVEKKYNVRIAIMTLPALPEKVKSKKYTDDMRLQLYATGPEKGSILMMVTDGEVGNRDYAISTGDEMRQIITDDGGYPYFEEKVLERLRESDFNGAFNVYVDTIDEMCAYYEENGEGYDPANDFSILGLLLGMICSAGIGWLFVEYLRGKMSNVRPADEASEYLDKNSIHYGEQSNVFIRTTVVRTKRSKKSSSGGGGSSGGGSGKF